MPKFAIDPATLALVEALADTARPLNDDDDFTDRQCAAQNLFFERVRTLLPRDQMADLESYCNGADTNEMIDEALRLISDLRPFDADRRDREASTMITMAEAAKGKAKGKGKTKRKLVFARHTKQWETATIEQQADGRCQWVRDDKSSICWVGDEVAIADLPPKPVAPV